MKTLKRLISVALIFTLLFFVPTKAEAETLNSDGVSFTYKDAYKVTKKLASAPHTYEAWIKVSKDLASSKRAGVILGNYSSSTTNSLSFEIHKNGNPRIYYKPKDKDATEHIFTDVDVRTGDWLHLAITVDREAGTVNCYVNGQLKSSVAKTLYDINFSSAPMIGGDPRANNTCSFLGNIRSVALYDDARTAEEIAADFNDYSNNSLLAAWNLSAQPVGTVYPDLSGNGYDVRYTKTWIDPEEAEPVGDYAYSFAIIGDTQTVSYSAPDKLGDIYDWIVANKESQNIQYVMHMGDFTEKDADSEWSNNLTQISKLNGVVPYSLVRGNHDSTEKFNATFNTDAYKNSFDGQYDSKLENTYRKIKVGKINYLIFTLDIGAGDDVLNWASEIIEAHPDYNVIITTHVYLYSDGTTHDANDTYPATKYGGENNGEDIWQKLVSKHDNIVLAACGHISSDTIQTTQVLGDKGNVVTHMLVDPQTIDKEQGSSGMVAMLYFSEDGKDVTVRYYSTIRDQYFQTDNFYSFEMNVIEADYSMGDVNLDGYVTSADFNTATLYLAGSISLTDEQLAKIDVNASGNIDSTDVLVIKQQLLGLV